MMLSLDSESLRQQTICIKNEKGRVGPVKIWFFSSNPSHAWIPPNQNGTVAKDGLIRRENMQFNVNLCFIPQTYYGHFSVGIAARK